MNIVIDKKKIPTFWAGTRFLRKVSLGSGLDEVPCGFAGRLAVAQDFVVWIHAALEDGIEQSVNGFEALGKVGTV